MTRAHPGHGDLYDGAIGGEADYDFGEVTLALGGAYHQSNGYRFESGRCVCARQHACVCI